MGNVGDRMKKDRPEAVSSQRSYPVLAGLITLAIPARRAGATSTISESGRLVLGVRSFTRRLWLRGLTRQPVRPQAFVVCLKFWLGLMVRYRLPQRQRIESPSIGLVRDLLLGRSLRFDHFAFAFPFAFSPSANCSSLLFSQNYHSPRTSPLPKRRLAQTRSRAQA
jgi:hypothetical protein